MNANNNLGNKAKNLLTMRDNGINVPKLICIEDNGRELDFDRLITEVDKEFGECELFSVRSSSNAEDSEGFSFAGQFDTYLNIKKQDVPQYAEKCRQSAQSKTITAYCRAKGIEQSSIKVNVLVQQMIAADMSGVMFTANPLGILNETVIVVGNGTGNNIVEDKVPATTYHYNLSDGIYCFEKQPSAPELSDALVRELIEISAKIKQLFGDCLDIEFAVKNGEIFILQARPITTLDTSHTVILDNSNIVESYPGITLPLTEDFVNRMYTGVFRAMMSRIIGNNNLLCDYDCIFREMTSSVNGRMYYKINNWYSFLSLLPFGERIIPVWQDMLGVADKSRQCDSDKLPKIYKAAGLVKLCREMLMCRKNNEKLDKSFREIESHFRKTFSTSLTIAQMKSYYDTIESALLCKWDVTLINDLYTFICAGLLKATLKKAGVEDYTRKANDLLSDITNLESMKPVRALAMLAFEAAQSGEIEAIRLVKTDEQAYEYLNCGTETARKMAEYADEFGDRYLEELKLESKTFRTDPLLLFERVCEYSQSLERIEALLDCDGSSTAHRQLDSRLSPLYSRLVRRITEKAAGGIRCREISRLNRSRVFGMVRTLFKSAGSRLANIGAIENANDVFYLKMDEVFCATANSNYRNTVAKRKQQYGAYSKMPAFSRLVFCSKEFSISGEMLAGSKQSTDASTLIGTACSSGTVEGEVLVIDKPDCAVNTSGKILVAKMTDPGWVFMLANAAGIISEKGSMLSHTAIISRELGIPAVVGVQNAASILQTGDRVRLNGKSGEITILDRLTIKSQV